MNRDQIKAQMVEALEIAEECEKEAALIPNTIRSSIIAVKIFDALSESKKSEKKE